MSRYSLKPLPCRSDVFEVAVGWDSALQTYFMVVFGVPAPGCDPEVLHWRGDSPGQIPSIEALRGGLDEYAVLEPELISLLQTDQSFERSQTPLRLSRFIWRLLDYG